MLNSYLHQSSDSQGLGPKTPRLWVVILDIPSRHTLRLHVVSAFLYQAGCGQENRMGVVIKTEACRRDPCVRGLSGCAVLLAEYKRLLLGAWKGQEPTAATNPSEGCMPGTANKRKREFQFFLQPCSLLLAEPDRATWQRSNGLCRAPRQKSLIIGTVRDPVSTKTFIVPTFLPGTSRPCKVLGYGWDSSREMP